MGDVRETVACGDLRRPPLGFLAPDLNGAPALAADVVVVMAGAAAAVAGLSVLGAQDVDLAAASQGAKLVVDGGEPDVLATGPQLGEQVLGGAKPVRGVQDGGKGAFLARRALPRAPGQPGRTAGHRSARCGLAVVARGAVVPVMHLASITVTGRGVLAPHAVQVIMAGPSGNAGWRRGHAASVLGGQGMPGLSGPAAQAGDPPARHRATS